MVMEIHSSTTVIENTNSNINTIGNYSTINMQGKMYDITTDCDYVSHKDGSVISRREWYVWICLTVYRMQEFTEYCIIKLLK